MNKLFLEPYYGGSHKSFADTYIDEKWTLLTLPAKKWSWRMRHAAITFAHILNEKYSECRWDQIFATDMMNFAEFIALAPPSVRSAEKIFYFHENQLTYPDTIKKHKDYNHAFTNFVSAIAADRVLFNSHYHKNEFLDAITKLLQRMPDYRHVEEINKIRAKSEIFYPPSDISIFPRVKNDVPVITWAARWEKDKNPQDFFAVIDKLIESGIKFRINVLGGNSERSSIGYLFNDFKKRYESIIDAWGFVSRSDYENILNKTDIFISTAIHEFYGISAVEANKAGAFCILPNRLAYPEVFKNRDNVILYGQTSSELFKCLNKKISIIFPFPSGKGNK
jgi:glycosyltransferase involved in cell wall biosynthesis